MFVDIDQLSADATIIKESNLKVCQPNLPSDDYENSNESGQESFCCNNCTFKTFNKRHLKQHMLNYNIDFSEGNWFVFSVFSISFEIELLIIRFKKG